MDTLTQAQRTKINKKFASLIKTYDLDREMEATSLAEKEELQIMLFSSPTLNDVQEYCDGKKSDWSAGLLALGEGDRRRKAGMNFVVLYDRLVGFLDGLK